MKNNMKILTALIVASLPMLSVNAQVQLPAPSGSNGTVPISTPMSVGQGNVYEKEVTPLLRDISKKKSLLELRKLDRELEKLEEEALSAQIERDKAINPPMVNVNPTSPNFGQNISAATAQSVAPQAVTASSAAPESDIRVLMVYGFDNDLYAKISSGSQGGYIVRKGDTLPDGRIVTNINPSFLEVKKGSKTKGVDKLYVSGPLPVKAGATVSSPATSMGTPGSTMLPPPSAQTPFNTALPPGAVIVPNSTPLTVPSSGAVMMRK